MEEGKKKYKEMVEQNQQDKISSLKEKEKAFETIITSLNEQLISKEESINYIQLNQEILIKQQIYSANIEYKNKFEEVNNEKEKLIKKIDDSLVSKVNVIIFVILSILLGLIIGFLF